MSELVSANDSNFDNLLEDQRAIIVDFWSPTCAPCKVLEPNLQKIAVEYRASLKILKVNVNESPQTSAKYMIRGLPTLLFIKNKSVKSQLIGAVNPKQIEEKVREII